MITPKFTITQNDEFVIVTIKVPYIRMSTLELITEDCNFSFFCQPYLLKLTFSYGFREEDEECKATYDPFNDNGTLIAYLPKAEHGQHFPDLDLTTKLLQLSKKKNHTNSAEKVSSIEVLNSENFEMDEDDEEEMNASLPSPFLATRLGAVTYGFNNMYSRVFADLRDELLDMTEIKHPDQIRPQYRSVLRISAENQLFDPARYLGDQLDGEMDPIYAEAMPFRPFYSEQWDIWKSAKKVALVVPDVKSPHSAKLGTDLHGKAEPTRETDAGKPSEQSKHTDLDVSTPANKGEDPRNVAFDAVGGFSEAEKETLATKLPNKEYLIPPGSGEQESVLLGLVDILFAFCYDHRITLGEGNVESAHTVSRLSCTLSWLEDFSLMQPTFNPSIGYDVQKVESSALRGPSTVVEGADTKVEACWKSVAEERVANVIKYSLRRCMIYPFLRVWKLARKVLADVAKILFLGKRAVLKCLLQVRSTFEHTDTHYLLNKVYIDDYCIWLQTSLAHEQLQAFAKVYNIAKGSIEKLPCTGKELMGLYLPEIEEWAEQRGAETGSESETESESESESDSESDNESESESEEDSDDSGKEDDTTNKRNDFAQDEKIGEVDHTSDKGQEPLMHSRAEEFAPLSTKSGQFSVKTADGPGSTVADGEEEWTVPAKFTDYQALQLSDPRLSYLTVSDSSVLDVLGAAEEGKSLGSPAMPVKAPTSSALNNMLLLPKRKAEAQLEALIAGKPTPAKRPLIEEYVPRSTRIEELEDPKLPAQESETYDCVEEGKRQVDSALSSQFESLEIRDTSISK